MKYSILGFNQINMVKLGLDLDEALILRYFIDFKDSGKMIKRTIGNEAFYWVNYESLKEALPVLNISKDRVYRKLKNLANMGVLKHTTIKEGGTFSYFTIGPKYLALIDTDFPIEKNEEEVREEETVEPSVKLPEGQLEKPKGLVNVTEPSVKIPEGYGENNGGGTVKIPEGYGENNGANNKSIKYSSIKNNKSIKEIYMQVIEYLNKKLGSSYRATSQKTQQLIRARVNEGFGVDDFITVIDKKVAEWSGTEFSIYLRPETLFGTKFESYLNQKVSIKTSPNNSAKGYFNNFDQREYDYNALEEKLRENTFKGLGEEIKSIRTGGN